MSNLPTILEATVPFPEVATVMVTWPVWVTDDGLNVALEFGGNPLTLNVTVPTPWPVERFVVKVKEPELPAVTLTLALEFNVIATGRMVA